MKKLTFLINFIALTFILTGCATMKNTNSKNGSYTIEELIIPNGDCSIYGTIVKPEITDEKLPVIIISHGYNGCRTDFYADAYQFASHGYITYCYDFCGGSTRSKSTGRSTTEMTIFTERDDIVAVYDYFAAREDVDTSRIFIMGASQGGLASVLATEKICAENPDKVKGLVLYFPALCIPDNWNSRYATVEEIPETVDFWGMKLGKDFFVALRDLDPYELMGQNYKNNVLIIHGTVDAVVPLSYSERAVKTYGKKRAMLITHEGQGHGFTPEYNNLSHTYVEKFLKAQQ